MFINMFNLIYKSVNEFSNLIFKNNKKLSHRVKQKNINDITYSNRFVFIPFLFLPNLTRFDHRPCVYTVDVTPAGNDSSRNAFVQCIYIVQSPVARITALEKLN